MGRLARQQRFEQPVLFAMHVDAARHHAGLVLGPFDRRMARGIQGGPGGLAVVAGRLVQVDVALAVPANTVVSEPLAEHVLPRLFRGPGHLVDEVL